MLDFLKVPYDESDVRLKLSKDFETFHRHSSASFEHYTRSQKIIIQDCINKTLIQLKENDQPTLGLEMYLLQNFSSII